MVIKALSINYVDKIGGGFLKSLTVVDMEDQEKLMPTISFSTNDQKIGNSWNTILF